MRQGATSLCDYISAADVASFRPRTVVVLMPIPTRARECLRTPAALAESGLLWEADAYSIAWTWPVSQRPVPPPPNEQDEGRTDALPDLPAWAQDALQSKPQASACFAPRTLQWHVSEPRDDLVIEGPWSPIDSERPRVGPLFYTDDTEAGRRHIDVVHGHAWITSTQEAALPSSFWHAFRTARAQTPGPGQTPASEVVRALHVLARYVYTAYARILGNALAGVDRPVPLDGKAFSQQLRWDAPLQSLFEVLAWRVAPLEDEQRTRPALFAPKDLNQNQAIRTRTARLWLELAVLCVFEGGAPPPLPDAAPASLAWHIQRASPLGPVLPAPPDARVYRMCARLGLGTHEVDAQRAEALYRWQVACFPTQHTSVFYALERLQASRPLGEPGTLAPLTQSPHA